MLESLQISNFRGFAAHRVDFGKHTVIVGRNNAGKSTVVEALRLTSLVSNRLLTLAFRDAPEWTNLSRHVKGVSPDVSREGLNIESAFHRYGEPPAIIVATYSTGVRLRLHLSGDARIFAEIIDGSGRGVHDRAKAKALEISPIAILPQVRPLQIEEDLLNDAYVRKSQDSPLSPLHFRNQLRLGSESRGTFDELVESTWPGVRVLDISTDFGAMSMSDKSIKPKMSLLVQNGDFAGEASTMGHGLQMWLQTIWFLARTTPDATVILDEPDVYMHPELQRRLLKLVVNRHEQSIITTHSNEIVSSTSAESILVLDKRSSVSRRSASSPSFQRAMNALGSPSNASLARMAGEPRFISVDSESLVLISRVHEKTKAPSDEGLLALPRSSEGGWECLKSAIQSGDSVDATFGESVRAYFILSPGFRHESVIHSARTAARKLSFMQCHILKLPDFLNYLLVPAAIQRILVAYGGRKEQSSLAAIKTLLRTMVESLREETIESLAFGWHDAGVFASYEASRAAAQEKVTSAFKASDGGMSVTHGRRLAERLSTWSVSAFGEAITATTLADALLPSEIATELTAIFAAINEGRPFSGSSAQRRT